MTSSAIHVRRATFGDYEAVLNINRSIDEGRDYMPTLFYQFLQSKRHVMYVAETDTNEIIGLINYRLEPDGKTALSKSGRVREDYQGKGVTRMIHAQLHGDYPNLTDFVYGGILRANTERIPEKFPCLFQLNYLQMVLTADELQHLKTLSSAVTSSPSPSNAIQLTHSRSVAMVTSGSCERFLGQFSVDYICGCDVHWRPVRLCKDDLKELLAANYVLVTYVAAGEQKGHTRSSSERDEDDTGPRNESCSDRDIRALSFSSSMLLKTDTRDGEVVAGLFFYGKQLDDLSEHCQRHLHHLATVAGPSDLNISFGFPLEIDRTEVENQLVAASPGLRIEYCGRGYIVRANYRSLV